MIILVRDGDPGMIPVARILEPDSLYVRQASRTLHRSPALLPLHPLYQPAFIPNRGQDILIDNL